ncbi:hypothetical protein JAAARDRAFT_115233, partial [Jaapia argillacea MUCL 33604]
DAGTGMWVVEPEFVDGERPVDLIHVDSIVHACHLIGEYGHTRVPLTFRFQDSLDAFRTFYVSRYGDYHA